jgi:hypothetical protein
MKLGIKRYGLWKLSGGKMVFLGGSGAILEFLEWLEGLGAKDRGSCKFWGFSGIFLCKIVGIYQILDIFLNGKTR